jgi:hypothetical protein
MKTTNHIPRSLSFLSLVLPGTLAALLMSASMGKLVGQTESDSAKPLDEKITAAINAIKDGNAPQTDFKKLFDDEYNHRKQMTQELIKRLNDPASDNLAKCYAAYFLGVLHATEAADSLATQITISAPRNGHLSDMEAPWNNEPAAQALRMIGVPAIPALIRNLAESDDAKTRETSLRILKIIEGDKDVVRLRLQKALKAEKDSQKQARLQAALKSLANGQ